MIILEGQPDERRLIQTVNVGSEQNEVIELGAGRSFLCVLVGPRRGPNSIPRAVSPREGGFEKKIPRPPEGRSGGELLRGVEPIRRGSGTRPPRYDRG